MVNHMSQQVLFQSISQTHFVNMMSVMDHVVTNTFSDSGNGFRSFLSLSAGLPDHDALGGAGVA